MNKTEQDYSIEYGKTLERIRILDLIAESDLERFIKADLHDLITDTHPETDWGKREGRES